MFQQVQSARSTPKSPNWQEIYLKTINQINNLIEQDLSFDNGVLLTIMEPLEKLSRYITLKQQEIQKLKEQIQQMEDLSYLKTQVVIVTNENKILAKENFQLRDQLESAKRTFSPPVKPQIFDTVDSQRYRSPQLRGKPLIIQNTLIELQEKVKQQWGRINELQDLCENLQRQRDNAFTIQQDNCNHKQLLRQKEVEIESQKREISQLQNALKNQINLINQLRNDIKDKDQDQLKLRIQIERLEKDKISGNNSNVQMLEQQIQVLKEKILSQFNEIKEWQDICCKIQGNKIPSELDSYRYTEERLTSQRLKIEQLQDTIKQLNKQQPLVSKTPVGDVQRRYEISEENYSKNTDVMRGKIQEPNFSAQDTINAKSPDVRTIQTVRTNQTIKTVKSEKEAVPQQSALQQYHEQQRVRSLDLQINNEPSQVQEKPPQQTSQQNQKYRIQVNGNSPDNLSTQKLVQERQQGQQKFYAAAKKLSMQSSQGSRVQKSADLLVAYNLHDPTLTLVDPKIGMSKKTQASWNPVKIMKKLG